jgi:hypothetical protein
MQESNENGRIGQQAGVFLNQHFVCFTRKLPFFVF